jgi:hypothetical protein
MRFKLGLVAGFAAGYLVGSTPPDQRRTKVEELWTGVRDNPRVQRITDTVTSDAHRVTDAVEQRLVHTADGATRAIAGTAEPGEPGAGAATAEAESEPAPKRTSRSKSA